MVSRLGSAPIKKGSGSRATQPTTPKKNPWPSRRKTGMGGGLLTPVLLELDANTIPAKFVEFA